MNNIKEGSDAIKEIKELLPAVLDKMFPAPIEKFNWFKTIWFEVGESYVDEASIPLRQLCRHIPQISPVSEQDFIDHFSRKIIVGSMNERDDIVGWELSVDLNDRETNHVKSLCLQATGMDEYNMDKLLPKLDEYGVEYLIIRLVREIRVWIFCDTCVSLAGQFINKIVDESNIDRFYGCLDIFPIHSFCPKPPGFPGGHSGSAEFRGITSTNPIFIMKSILWCKPVPEMQMLDALQKPINDTESADKHSL